MLVRLERGDQPRRGRIHESTYAVSMPVERGAKTADIGACGLEGPQLHRADTGGANKLLFAHDGGELPGERRMRCEIERGLALDMAAEAGKPLGDVGRVADLAELAIADDGDTRRDLLLHGI